MARIGYRVEGKLQKWLYERGLDRRQYAPVSLEQFSEAAQSVGLYRSGDEPERMVVLFRAGVEFPPKSRVKRFLARKSRWAAKIFAPLASDYRYVYADNFSYNRGVASAAAPAYIVREVIAYEYDEKKIVGVRVQEDLLYRAPSQEDFERWGSGDLEDPGKIIERHLGLPREEVVSLPEPAVEIRLLYGFAKVFVSEAAGFVKQDLARKEEDLQEFRKEHDEFLRS